MTPSKAPAPAHTKSSPMGMMTVAGVSTALHAGILALIIGWDHRVDTAPTPVPAIEMIDARSTIATTLFSDLPAGSTPEPQFTPASPGDSDRAVSPPKSADTDADPEDVAETSRQDASPGLTEAADSTALPLDTGTAPSAAGLTPAEPRSPDPRLTSSTDPIDPKPDPVTAPSAMAESPPLPLPQPSRKPPVPAPPSAGHARATDDLTVKRPASSARLSTSDGSAPALLPAAPSATAGQGANRAARALSNPPPQYPAIARRRRQEGRVVLRVLVSASGTPEGIELVESSGVTALDKAADEAIRRWRFHPALRDGVAIAGLVDIPIRFRLDEE